MKRSRKKAAVIGGGPSGIQAAGELARQNYEVTVFERGSELGGLWCYNKNKSITEKSTIKGVKPFLPNQVSAMYKDLRTNVTIQSMSIDGFLPPNNEDLRFVHRTEIMDYLNSYVAHLDKEFPGMISYRFNSNVDSVENDNDWWITYNTKNTQNCDRFDVVVVASGAFHKPLTVDLHDPGFDGVCFHSLYYDDPSVLMNKTVLIIGAKNSARDMFWDGMEHAKHVILASPREKDRNNVIIPKSDCSRQLAEKCTYIGRVKKINKDGSVVHTNWNNEEELLEQVKADVVIYCTGYKREFPFLSKDLQPSYVTQEGKEISKCLLKTVHEDYLDSLFFFHPSKSRTPFNTLARETYAQARLIGYLAGKNRFKVDQLKRFDNTLEHWFKVIYEEWEKESLNTCSCVIHNPLFMNYLNAIVEADDRFNIDGVSSDIIMKQVRTKMKDVNYRKENTIWHAGMELRKVAESANWNLFKFLRGRFTGGPGYDERAQYEVTWYYENGEIHSVYSERDIKYEHLIFDSALYEHKIEVYAA